MIIREIKEKIDSTEYWDLEVLDFNINYFGDEVSMIIYNDDVSSWKLSFISCYKLKYETDANWRDAPDVRCMRKSQLGYYGQDITVTSNEESKPFINVKMDLSIMQVEFSFKKFILEKVKNSEMSFFWDKE